MSFGRSKLAASRIAAACAIIARLAVYQIGVPSRYSESSQIFAVTPGSSWLSTSTASSSPKSSRTAGTLAERQLVDRIAAMGPQQLVGRVDGRCLGGKVEKLYPAPISQRYAEK